MHRITRMLLRAAAKSVPPCHHVSLAHQFQINTLNLSSASPVLTLTKKMCNDVPQNATKTDFVTEPDESKIEIPDTSFSDTLSSYKQAGDWHSLLKTVTVKTSLSNTCELIVVLSNMKKDKQIKDSDYLSDHRFLKLMKILESPSIGKLQPLAMVSCLKGLQVLDIPAEAFSVKNLENSLTWSARSCGIKDLVMMLSFSASRRSSDSQQKLFSEICRAIERRWVEIKDGRQFAGLIHYSEHFSDQFMAKLEDRIAELVAEMSGGDLAMVLYELGRKRKRNLPLLKAITFYLGRNRTDLDIKQASDVLFALKQLSFKDQEVLEKICSTIEDKVEGVESQAVIRSTLTSLGQLRYLHTGVMDKILAWYNNRREVLNTRDLVSILITCANLNYCPRENAHFIDFIASKLDESLFKKMPKREIVWLDVVWSLVVLQRATHKQLESVLTNDFHTSLLYSHDNRNLGATLKLLNINAAASKIFKNYKGPTLNICEDPLLREINISPSLNKVKLNNSVIEAFSNLVPPPRFLRVNVNTLMGFVADAEFVVDVKNNPMLVDEFANSFGTVTPSKQLPAGASRVALIVAGFQDCLVGGGLGGVTALSVKLAEASGYQVLVVKYTDVETNMKLLTRVQRLDKILKAVLKKEEL